VSAAVVYDRQYCVVPLAFGELGDEIEGNVLEGESVLGCRDAVDGGSLPVREDLVLLTSCTTSPPL